MIRIKLKYVKFLKNTFSTISPADDGIANRREFTYSTVVKRELITLHIQRASLHIVMGDSCYLTAKVICQLNPEVRVYREDIIIFSVNWKRPN